MEASLKVSEFSQGWHARDSEVFELQSKLRDERAINSRISNEIRILHGDLKAKTSGQKDIKEKVEKASVNPKSTKGFIPSEVPDGYISILFDGGTSNNCPPFGYGYGSFRVDNGVEGDIVRLEFNQKMSANAAEVKTAIAALKYVQKHVHGNYKVWISGDSQIAIGWIESAFQKTHKKISTKSSESFKQIVGELRSVIHSNLRISDLQAVWRPRKYSVEVFGH